MIGILLALQVNNWNEARKDVTREVKILSTLQKDFLANQLILENAIEQYPGSIQGLTDKINIIGTPFEDLSSKKITLITRTGYHSAELIDGSLNAVLSSDQLELISNDSLKEALTAFPAQIKRFKTQEANVKRIVLEKHRGILGSYISLSENLSRSEEQRKKFPNLKQRAIASDFSGLLQDRDYQNVLMDELMQTRNLHRGANNLLQKTKALENLLSQELDHLQ